METGYEGYVEAVVDGRVQGWVWRPASPGRRISVHVLLDGREVASGRADHPRAGLADAGIGDGAYVFDVPLPPSAAGSPGHRLEVRVGPERWALPTSAAFATQTGRHGWFAQTAFVPVRRVGMARWRRLPIPPPRLLLLAGVVLFGALLIFLSRRHLFGHGEWDLVAGRPDWELSTLWRPHDGQLAVVTVMIYKALLGLFGMDATWAWRVLVALLHGACVVLLWCIARRRLGDWWATLPAGLLLVLGAGWPVLLGWQGIGTLGAVAAGLGALLLLDHATRRDDLLACGLLVLACACSADGVLLALVAGAGLLGPARRRLWVAAVPLLGVLGWWIGYGAPAVHGDGVLDLPRDLVQGLAGTLGGLVGVGRGAGYVLLVAGAALLAAKVRPTVRARAALGGLGALWIGVALTHGDAGAPHRYVGAVLVLLLIAGQARAPRAVPGRAPVVLAGAFLLIGLSGYAELVHRAEDRNTQAARLRAALGAVQIAGDAADGTSLVLPAAAPELNVAAYRDAARRYGPAVRLGDAVRPAAPASVDQVLVRLERIRTVHRPLTAAGGSTTPDVRATRGGVVSNGARCGHFTPSGATPGRIDVVVPPGRTLLIATTANGRVTAIARRFAARPVARLAEVRGNRTIAATHFPPDRAAAAWVVRLRSADRVQFCSAGR